MSQASLPPVSMLAAEIKDMSGINLYSFNSNRFRKQQNMIYD
jgi:hypothetical protein